MNLCDNTGWDIDEPGYLDTLFHGYLPRLERKVSESSSHRIRTISQPKLYNPPITSMHLHRPTQSTACTTLNGSMSANFYVPQTTKNKIRFRMTPQLTDDQQQLKNTSQSPLKKKPKYTIINMSQLLSITPKIKVHHDQLNKVLERFSKKK